MKKNIGNKPKAIIFALACVASWAFIPVVSRFGQQTLDNYQFLFWSSLLSCLVLLISTKISGNWKHFKSYSPKNLISASALGFMGSFLYYLLLYFAYTHAKGIEVLAIQYTWPIFIVFFSIIFLKEKLEKKTIIASILGFLGVITVLTKGNFLQIYLDNMTTNSLVLVAAMTFGLFSVLSKKMDFEPYSATTIFFASATLFSYLSMLTFSKFLLPDLSSLMPLVVNGAIINGLSYILWLKALRYADAKLVSQFVFLTPVLASFFVVVIFKEKFYPIYYLGMTLVVGSGLIAQSK